MGESITEATIGEIFKSSGSSVKMDEEVLELETDKVNQVLYAPQEGIINFTVKRDETVKVGQVIGWVERDGNSKEKGEGPKAKKGAAEESSEKEPVKKEASKKLPPSPEKTSSTLPSNGGSRFSKEAFISSLEDTKQEKSLSPREKDVSLASATSHLPEPAAAPIEKTPKASISAQKPETRRRMPKIRKVIAQRLVEAQHTAAMLTTFNEADMTNVMKLRENFKDSFTKKHGVKLGFMSFFVKACVAALKEVPQVNSYIDGEDIVRREYYDIGIAVGTERGLVVPVLRGCDRLSVAGIEQGIMAFANKAREGTLTVDDLQGGGFTITNGGIYGSLLSTPILNPPQSGILGMHKIMKRPMVVDDAIVIRPMMYLALSYDHRIVDGQEAVTFLVHVKNCIEDPSRLLLDL